jgi:hypothetical protein
MDIQTVLVCLTVLTAALYLSRATWRTWSGRGCRSGCGCGPKKQASEVLIPVSDLGARVRSRHLEKSDERDNSGSFST